MKFKIRFQFFFLFFFRQTISKDQRQLAYNSLDPGLRPDDDEPAKTMASQEKLLMKIEVQKIRNEQAKITKLNLSCPSKEHPDN